MLIVPIIQYAAALTAATLTLSSGNNMIQTWRIIKNNSNKISSSISSSIQKNENNGGAETAIVRRLRRRDGEERPPAVTSSLVLDEIRNLSRRDFIELWHDSTLCRTTPTTLAEIHGEWDGTLTKNGPILTSVTKFLTNRLFGRGRKWNGKAFLNDTTGKNRFYSSSTTDETTSSSSSSSEKTTTTIEMEHEFEYSIRPSYLSDQTNVIGLDYTKSQSRISLWKSMVDEIRIVDVQALRTKVCGGCDGPQQPQEPDQQYQILLGLGSMAWSGGMLNASPFCLYRKTRKVGE